MSKRNERLEDKHRHALRIHELGLTVQDYAALKRIATRLHKWDELECGTNEGCIERDEDGTPWFTWDWPGNKGPRGRRQIVDDELRANEALEKIAKKHPDLVFYHQGDPRGLSLYVMRRSDVVAKGGNISQWYSSIGLGVS